MEEEEKKKVRLCVCARERGGAVGKKVNEGCEVLGVVLVKLFIVYRSWKILVEGHRSTFLFFPILKRKVCNWALIISSQILYS